jgi:rubrerythrin
MAAAAGPDPVPDRGRRPFASLVADMELALRSEHGARVLYGLLRRAARNAELARVLAALEHEQEAQVEALAALMTELGGRPRRRSWRRTLVSWGVFLATPLTGMRPPLRLSVDAEETVSRWYAMYAEWLAGRGEEGPARRCRELSLTKSRHAQVLRAFLENVYGTRIR